MQLQSPAAESESIHLFFVSIASDRYHTQLSTVTEKGTTMRIAGPGLSFILMTPESIESENSKAIRKSLWPRSLHGDSSYIALRLTALLHVSGAFNCVYYVHFVASDVTLGDNNMWCADDDSGSSDEDGASSVEVSVCEVTNYTSQLHNY